jgi:arylsulfatase A-like enzyme
MKAGSVDDDGDDYGLRGDLSQQDQSREGESMKQNRRRFLKTTVRALMGMVLAGCVSVPGTSNAATDRKPNVIIFLTDDQGTLDANCYGSKDLYTPAMDDLAKTGVRFTQAYAHQVCCPTRAILMTGRYPQRSAVNSWTQGNAKAPGKGRNMFLEEVTLAEALKGAGYRTAIFGKWHLGAHVDHGPTKQGFDEYFGLRGGFIDNYNHHFLHGKGFHDLYEGTKEIFAKGEYFPDMMTKRALQYVDKNKDVTFFMYVAFNIPHYPEQADKQFDERYRDMKEPRRSYAKMISTTDDRMRMIIARLEKHGIRDDTIILFMGDNGHSAENYRIGVGDHTSGLPKGSNYGANGGGGNTGKWRGHKGNFYEGGIRTPAIISWPKKLPSGAVRDQAVTGQDWYPTILELCKVPLPEVKLDGQSVVPIIRSAKTATHHKLMHWQWEWSWAVREGDWKLMGRNKEASHLGNLSDTEPEKKNYIKEKPDIAKRLLDLHNEWLKEVESAYYEQYPNSTKMY